MYNIMFDVSLSLFAANIITRLKEDIETPTWQQKKIFSRDYLTQ